MWFLLIRLGGICLLHVSANAVVVGFTPPVSLLRLVMLPVTIYGVYEALPICLEATGRALWAALAASFSISSLFQYLDTALLSRWSADVLGPTCSSGTYVVPLEPQRRPMVKPNPSGLQRLRFGFHLSVSTRKVGTSYQVKGVSSFSTKDTRYLPSREAFLLNKALVLLICYLVLDLSTLTSQPDQNQVLYHDARISMFDLNNLTLEQLLVRSVTTLGFWLNVYCIIEFYMGPFAFFTVGIGASKIECWPPGFGPVSEAYSIRRFWG